MKNLTWPQVAAVVAVLLVVGTLALMGVDTTAIVALVVALLLGGVAVGQQQIRDQTNGNHSAMLDVIREQGKMLARSPALPPDVPPAVPVSDVPGGAPQP